jgi:DNA-binding MarR family transcriptional regulator
LILEVFRLNGRMLAAGDALTAPLGLSSARWQVLGAIALSPIASPVAHLARNMGLTRQAVQRVANELASAGFVTWRDNPHHRRAKLLVLTEKGAAAFEKAMALQRPWLEALTKGLDAGLVAQAHDVLRTLRQRLE